ncbi:MULTISPECIES: hypothetical protein [Actinomadura]|uniref:Transposase n=1 Tax=Actinomadura yumaensis TaxID=111807 RepID=A0ABW2CMK1_9ACTN|nr:hypothetical protein [Actinomadura sp. J1-007]MWK34243.1 hypothetical protein [Actinomadura sp. J1-007]
MALLSAWPPKLTAAPRRVKEDGLHLLVLDGTLIACDRARADRPHCPAEPLPRNEHAGHRRTRRANAQLKNFRIVRKLR